MALESEDALRQAVSQRRPISLGLSEIGAQRLLEILAASGSSHRVTVEGISTTVTIEIGNGLVVGARTEHEGGPVGREAYALLRTTRRGEVHVQPLRFPSLANILEPIEELPEIAVFSSGPPPLGTETIELVLPEARSLTVELDLDDVDDGVDDGDDLGARATPIELPSVEIELPPMTAKRQIRPPRLIAAIAPVVVATPSASRRWPWLAAAAVIMLGLGTAGWATLSPSFEGEAIALDPGPTVARTAEPDDEASEPADDAEREAAADEDEGAVNGERSDTRAQARALARRARRLLRHDRDAAALTAARRAARLRQGMPYYQVLLGDALAANGHRAAARRAYRRALRLHPGYRPAQRRLGEASSPLASRT